MTPIKKVSYAIGGTFARMGKSTTYEDCAKAAIEAMKEPTEYMSDVGAQKLFDEMGTPKEPTVIDRVWASMIDQALKE